MRTRSFQMYPPRAAFLKSIVFSVGIHRFSVDGRAKRRNIYAFLYLPGLVWTGPKFAVTLWTKSSNSKSNSSSMVAVTRRPILPSFRGGLITLEGGVRCWFLFDKYYGKCGNTAQYFWAWGKMYHQITRRNDQTNMANICTQRALIVSGGHPDVFTDKHIFCTRFNSWLVGCC